MALSDEQQKSSADQFATTHWSVVLAAGRRGSSVSDAALETLCKTYWYPLYAYVRRRVPDVHEAQDLTQAFFERLLEKNYVADADRERGRFRAFLLTAFKHFLSKEWDKAKAQKRGGGQNLISLDFASGDSRYAFEPSAGLTPEQLYERQWAVALLNQVMERLENEFTREGKQGQFERLKGFLLGQQAGTTYAAVAAALGSTEAAAKMAAHRMRRRYRELLRKEISETVADNDDVDEEMRSLFAAL